MLIIYDELHLNNKILLILLIKFEKYLEIPKERLGFDTCSNECGLNCSWINIQTNKPENCVLFHSCKEIDLIYRWRDEILKERRKTIQENRIVFNSETNSTEENKNKVFFDDFILDEIEPV